jgi:hypothetical protein
MTLTRFHHLTQVHGANLDRWPAEHHAAARELITHSDEARRILAEAAALDHLLDQAGTRLSDARLENMIAELDRRIESPADAEAIPYPPVRPPPHHLWPTAGFLAAMALLGFLGGDPNLLQPSKAPAMHIADAITPSYSIAWGK